MSDKNGKKQLALDLYKKACDFKNQIGCEMLGQVLGEENLVFILTPKYVIR